jgi:hypothetical protein
LPNSLLVDWLPLGGPHFGASGKINLALYDALRSMSQMSTFIGVKDTFASPANELKKSIVSHLWNAELGTLRMTDNASPNGICQDINAYSVTLGISPFHPNTTQILASIDQPPLAFQNLERWDKHKIISPYASGFAAEALFSQDEGVKAVQLIETVWAEMSSPSNPNYSGGHWEAMAENGSPINSDTSLVHGWSTWPVFLLPKYLTGLEPIEPGWVKWSVQPVLAGLDSVDVQLHTPAGDIAVSLTVEETQGTGQIIIDVPEGTTGEIQPPLGWHISECPKKCERVPGEPKILVRKGGKVAVKIDKANTSASSSTNNEKVTAEVVEDVEVPGVGIWSKSIGLVQFLKSLFGRCF